METLGDKITPKSAGFFHCNYCDVRCSKLSDYNRHILTSKHAKYVKANDLVTNGDKNCANFICHICSKNYKSRNGLWKHNKTCQLEKQIETTDKDQLILMLIKQNTELIKEQTDIKQLILEQQNIVLEIAKNGTHNTTHTNSHNKSFNLNFFLNETCKDAMNIMDFVDSIKIQLSDVEKVGELGYVEGISNIIIKNLKALDITKRPVHCTDRKRETMYVKDQDKWEKDEEQKTMHKVVRKIAWKNQNSLQMFRDAHPDCGKYHSKFSDQYNKLIVESMGGPGDNELEKEDKIIKKISKEVFVDK